MPIVIVDGASQKAVPSLTGTWQINFDSGTQRGVTLQELPDGTVLLRTGGNLSGKYRWSEDRLTVEQPDDTRFQGLVWQRDGKDLVLVAEPPDHPAGPSYVGTRMKFVSSDTSNEARAHVQTLPFSETSSTQFQPIDLFSNNAHSPIYYPKLPIDFTPVPEPSTSFMASLAEILHKNRVSL